MADEKTVYECAECGVELEEGHYAISIPGYYLCSEKCLFAFYKAEWVVIG